MLGSKSLNIADVPLPSRYDGIQYIHYFTLLAHTLGGNTRINILCGKYCIPL